MDNYAIQVNGVGKEFLSNPLNHFSLRKQAKDSHWSIKDVSFSVKPGESVAILGGNGSGKSTLLKLILGVTSPTKGNIKINGKIGGLIELGAGFHKELTGRENIYINGVVLGLKEKEVDLIIDDIIEFSELGSHIDKPVKQYSSGMRVRLGFSIAIHVDSDIVLLDEVLAVGDAKFREKALAAIKQYLKGKTIVFVSHSKAQVKQVCEKGIVIDEGMVAYEGEIRDAVDVYDEIIKKKKENVS
ncbi:ATP-binding cassette domain-containing protein [Halobacillus halophilus]|uniref:ABC transporter ATP-binding protein n=1 Tax=Halobacillus halophilus TaxID=1570 RepID=UPI001371CD09|nr:ABC transporter ATP-binding protein [Halobacillus halophilus]MYL30761.1 ATP-binding cassette domain-containing protein [Halobacillus halophilus]